LGVFSSGSILFAQSQESGTDGKDRPEVQSIQMNVVQNHIREDEKNGPQGSFAAEPSPGPADTLSNVQKMQTQANKILTKNLSRFEGALPEGLPTREPSLNVEETAKEVVITMDLPGMKKKDIEVRVRDGFLTVKGKRSFSREEGDSGEKGEFYRQERFEGRFEKRIPLPPSLAEETIRADYKGGVLTIRADKIVSEREPALENSSR